MSSASSASSSELASSSAASMVPPLSSVDASPNVPAVPVSPDASTAKIIPEEDEESSDSELVDEADVEYCECADDEIELWAHLAKSARGTCRNQSIIFRDPAIAMHHHLILFQPHVNLSCVFLRPCASRGVSSWWLGTGKIVAKAFYQDC
jgi:hypothetical protein